MNKTNVAVNIFNKRAEDYHAKYKDVSIYKESLDFFVKQINKKASILELACGPGNITKYLLDRNPLLDILGVDLAPNMLQIAKSINPKAHFELMDCKLINTFNRKFEAIMAGFYWPYLSKNEVFTFIQDAHKLLEPKGIMYISTMENDYEKSGVQTSSKGDKMFIHYHEEKYLVNYLQNANFQILYTGRVKNLTDTDLILIAKKYD